MKRDRAKWNKYWTDIPVGKNNAITYEDLEIKWGIKKRTIRLILQYLSTFNAPDDTVLIRSSGSRGFYRSDDLKEIDQYRKECLNRAYACMSPAKRCKAIMDKKRAADDVSLFDEL